MSHSRTKTALTVATISTLNALSTALTSAIGGADLTQSAVAATITGVSTPLTTSAIFLLLLNPSLEKRLVYSTPFVPTSAFLVGMEVLGSQVIFTLADALFDVGLSRALFSTCNGIGFSVLFGGALLYQDLVLRQNIMTNERNSSYIENKFVDIKNKFVGFFSSQNISPNNSQSTPSEKPTPTPR